MGNFIKLWLSEIRANFLLLAVFLVMIGGAAAWHSGAFDTVIFLYTLTGIILAHISANLFNEYSDWKTGIDANTERTPFSGGSGNLHRGLIPPSQVRNGAWITLALAFLIGVKLTLSAGWPVVVLMGIGGLTVAFYTDYIAKWMVGELAAGLSLGSLVVIGSYFVQTGAITSEIIWASVPPGILTSLLLFLNEFPDTEADRAGGRKHLVIVFGKRTAGIMYAVLLGCVYLVLVLGIIRGELPALVLIGLLPLPLAAAAAYRVVRSGSETAKIIPALGMNVAVVLGTDFLMAVGYLFG